MGIVLKCYILHWFQLFKELVCVLGNKQKIVSLNHIILEISYLIIRTNKSNI